MDPAAAPDAVAEGTLVPDAPAPSAVEAMSSLPYLVGAGLLIAVVVALWWRSRQAGASRTLQLEDRAMPGVDLEELAGAEAPEVVPAAPGLAERLTLRMSRTREALQSRFDTLFGGSVVDDSLLVDLEEALLIADVGVPTTEKIVQSLRETVTAGEKDPAALRSALREEVRGMLHTVHRPFVVDADAKPFVLLVVGVNGSGKTTTIGKLAAAW